MDVPRCPLSEDHDDDDFARLSQLLLSAHSFDTFLTELLDYAYSVQTGHSCSLTVRTGHRPAFTIAADRRADPAAGRTAERQQRRALPGGAGLLVCRSWSPT